NARGDGWMGELEEQCPRSGSEQEHRLAVERPRLRSGTVEALDLVGLGDPAWFIDPRHRHERRIGHGTLGRRLRPGSAGRPRDAGVEGLLTTPAPPPLPQTSPRAGT